MRVSAIAWISISCSWFYSSSARHSRSIIKSWALKRIIAKMRRRRSSYSSLLGLSFFLLFSSLKCVITIGDQRLILINELFCKFMGRRQSWRTDRNLKILKFSNDWILLLLHNTFQWFYDLQAFFCFSVFRNCLLWRRMMFLITQQNMRK